MFNKDQQAQNAATLEMDIQREEVLAFFRDHWKLLLGFGLFLVLLTAGMQIYRAVETNTASEQTAAMLPLIGAPATAENAKALEDFAENKASGNRRALAMLYAAGKYQTAGQPEEMKRVLAAVGDMSAPESIKDYARLLAANSSNSLDVAKKIDEDSAWQPGVGELQALSTTDTQKRREIYAEIANNKTAPAALRKRAAEFSGENIGQ